MIAKRLSVHSDDIPFSKNLNRPFGPSLSVVSLFSGAGGFDLGIISAGHKVIWANDFDADCCETYSANLGPVIVCDDICSVPSAALPKADVVIGGFPCQGFSHANLLRRPSDDRNKLYLEFLRVIKLTQPRYFLAENVRGILSIADGQVIRQIVRDFEKAGYRVGYENFNLADYGVPQSRRRVIIWGTRVDVPKAAEFLPPPVTHAAPAIANKKGLRGWMSVGKALSGVPEPLSRHKLLNHVYSKYKVTNRNFTGHRPTDPTKPCPTILARGNGKGGVCAIHHPKNHRRMSIRESAFIQTFPLEYYFVGKMNGCYRQVGNAVPPLFALQLGFALKTAAQKLCSS